MKNRGYSRGLFLPRFQSYEWHQMRLRCGENKSAFFKVRSLKKKKKMALIKLEPFMSTGADIRFKAQREAEHPLLVFFTQSHHSCYRSAAEAGRKGRGSS